MLPSTLDMVPSPSTWNPRPSTLDPRQKDRLIYFEGSQPEYQAFLSGQGRGDFFHLSPFPQKRLILKLEGSALFDPFCCLRNHHHLFATGSFHFRTGQAKLSQSNFYSIHFLKVRHFPGKLTTNRFLEFFLKFLSRYNRLSKQSFVRFLYGAGPLATSSLA